MATVTPYGFGEHVEFAGFVDETPAFALADGGIRFPAHDGKSVQAHDGLLSATLSKNGKYLLSGGEDGKVMRTSTQTTAIVCEQPGKWIDVVAAGPNDAVGFASGRTAWVATGDEVRQFGHERAVEGLCFAPKGMRLACARYNGVSLHWVAGQGPPVDLHWDGAHTGVTFSPDGKYVVTTMAENALHGWRLDDKHTGDGKHMRMSGYPAKPKSLSWSPGGKWLASSGAPVLVCWPFTGKNGPMGKPPRELGTRADAMIVCVACHPSQQVVAIGYNDGVVMAVRIEDAAEHLLRHPGRGAISSLSWDRRGTRLAFGTREGEAGVIDIAG